MIDMNRRYTLLLHCDTCHKERMCKIINTPDEYFYVCKQCYNKEMRVKSRNKREQSNTEKISKDKILKTLKVFRKTT